MIDRLNQALRSALASEKLQARFKELSSVLPGKDEMAPEFVARMVPGEIEKYKVLLSDKK